MSAPTCWRTDCNDAPVLCVLSKSGDYPTTFSCFEHIAEFMASTNDRGIDRTVGHVSEGQAH